MIAWNIPNMELGKLAHLRKKKKRIRFLPHTIHNNEAWWIKDLTSEQ
jgi:hypothetical protein